MDLTALVGELQQQVAAYTSLESDDAQRFDLREQVRANALGMVRALDGPEQTMRTIARAFSSCTALKICVDLRVAECLQPGEEKSLMDLAAATSCHPRILAPVLRLLARQGIFQQTHIAVWRHTELSLLLRQPAFRAWLIQILEPKYRVTAHLPSHLKEQDYQCPVPGQTAFNSVYQTPLDFYSYSNEHDHEAAQNFAMSMDELARDQLASFVASYDLARLHPDTLFVDVAGGSGNLSHFLAERSKSAFFIVQDHSTVIDHAKRVLLSTGMSRDRVHFQVHDMFSPQPSYDRQRYPHIVFLLKIILHDHADEKCLILLRNLAHAMQSGDRILIIDTVISERGGGLSSCTSDLFLLGMSGSHHRTYAEFTSLIWRCDSAFIIRPFWGGTEEFDGLVTIEVEKP